MPAPVYESTTINHGVDGTTYIGTKPATLNDGDTLTAHITLRSNAATTISTVPSGWAEVGRTAAGSASIQILIYEKKVANATGEPENYSWVGTLSAVNSVVIVRSSGAEMPANASGVASDASGTGTKNFPRPTTTVADTLVLRVFSQTGGNVSAWSGTQVAMYAVQLGSGQTTRMMAGAYQTQAAAGQTDAETATVTSQPAAMGTVALAAGVTDTTPPSAPTGLTATAITE